MRSNDSRWVRTVSDWVSRDIKRTTGRPFGGHIFSRRSSKKIMMFFVSHAKEGTTERLWHAIETNERINGACLTTSKINGSQGHQDEDCRAGLIGLQALARGRGAFARKNAIFHAVFYDD
ncbi:hypothetical protein RB195_026519 [Necator americanus]|uniref:Uncharacterized protein n=1 Tax=Necator americanus TaxID=51031 RepID=A0ABR1EXQ0_NECAM